MKTTMESLKEMVDVNTIVGDAVETPDGTVIIPISKVAFGFATGGTEYEAKAKTNTNGDSKEAKFPFGGGTGAGISVQPVAFMIVGNGNIRLLPVNQNAMIERIIDLIPRIIDESQKLFKERKNEELNTTSTIPM